MPEYLATTVDKFTFRVATDRLYDAQGIWVKAETNGRVRVGLADFAQQSNGDVAFASVKPAGAKLTLGDFLGEIETIKAMVELRSPVSGTVEEVNPALELRPEIVNLDPYGTGWLAVVATPDWDAEQTKLLGPSAYFSVMQRQIQEELKKP